MSESSDNLQPLSEALEEHSAAGITILHSEPSRIARLAIIAFCVFVLIGLVWSIVGEVDVVIAAPGRLIPEGEERRIYSPVTGNVVALYVQEGDLVEAGTAVARLSSREAVGLEQKRLDAELTLENARRQAELFPVQRLALEMEAEAYQTQIISLQQQLDREMGFGAGTDQQIGEAQLNDARTRRDQAELARNNAKEEWDNARPLKDTVFSSSDIAKLELAYQQARTALNTAEADLAKVESQLIEEQAQKRDKLNTLRLQRDQAKSKLQQTRFTMEQTAWERQINVQKAEIAAEAANLYDIVNINGQWSVTIEAPMTGVVTQINFNQRGDLVTQDAPLLHIAPTSTNAILRVDIPEAKAAQLQAGSTPVKVKFNAYPYQRYGLIDGRLETISPTTRVAADGVTGFYEGDVRLDRTHFEVGGRTEELRYGMSAIAEIVVEQRRLIDYVIDPMRNI